MTMTAEIAGDTSGEIVNIGNFSIIGAKCLLFRRCLTELCPGL